MHTIGQRIELERKRLGFNAVSVAEKLNVDRITQRNYETDKRVPDAEYLQRAASIGIDVNFVITGNKIQISLAQDLASYKSSEVQRILEAFSEADPIGRAALMAVVELIKSKE